MRKKIPLFKRKVVMGKSGVEELLEVDIPDNSALMRMGEINHPAIIKFVRKYQTFPDTDYARLQRGYA